MWNTIFGTLFSPSKDRINTKEAEDALTPPLSVTTPTTPLPAPEPQQQQQTIPVSNVDAQIAPPSVPPKSSISTKSSITTIIMVVFIVVIILFVGAAAAQFFNSSTGQSGGPSPQSSSSVPVVLVPNPDPITVYNKDGDNLSGSDISTTPSLQDLRDAKVLVFEAGWYNSLSQTIHAAFYIKEPISLDIALGLFGGLENEKIAQSEPISLASKRLGSVEVILPYPPQQSIESIANTPFLNFKLRDDVEKISLSSGPPSNNGKAHGKRTYLSGTWAL